MKKIFALILLVVSFNSVFSQVIYQEFDSKKMKQFLASKTMFVLTGDKEFDDNLKAAVPKYWKVTPYDFISKTDEQSKELDASLSFFMFNEFRYTADALSSYNNEGTNLNSKTLYTLICGGKKLDRYNIEKEQIGFATSDIPTVPFANEYRLDIIIKGMNDGVDAVTKNSIKGGVEKVASSVFDVYCDRATLLKGKTLLIGTEWTMDRGKHIGTMINVNDLKSAGIKYEVKSREEIIELVKKGDSKYCYFCPTMQGTVTSSKTVGVVGQATIPMGAMVGGLISFIFDLESRSIIFADLNAKEFSFNKKAIDKLAAKMNGKN